MKVNQFKIAIFVSLVLAMATPGFCQGSGAQGAAGGGQGGMAPHPALPGAEINRHDPLAIYKEAGIDADQEKKIRQFAKDFEDGQRVRLKLMANLLRDMRALQMQPDPDEKKAIAKQEEINKVQSEMGLERIKLVLKIRSIMNFDQKQKLIQNMQKPGTGAAEH